MSDEIWTCGSQTEYPKGLLETLCCRETSSTDLILALRKSAVGDIGPGLNSVL